MTTGTSTSHSPHSPSPASTTGRRPSLPLALASIWLVVSVVTGAWLITNTPETDRVDVASPSMLPNSHHMSYGGDAYTGIQNAAADTERAVVDGVNELGALTIDLHEITINNERDLTNHLVQGVGVLVISLGVVNFNLALRPAIRARRVR